MSGYWGLSHIVLWTPLLIYIALRAPMINWRSVSGVWLMVFVATITVSLVLDYRDAFLWLLGDRPPIL